MGLERIGWHGAPTLRRLKPLHVVPALVGLDSTCRSAAPGVENVMTSAHPLSARKGTRHHALTWTSRALASSSRTAGACPGHGTRSESSAMTLRRGVGGGGAKRRCAGGGGRSMWHSRRSRGRRQASSNASSRWTRRRRSSGARRSRGPRCWATSRSSNAARSCAGSDRSAARASPWRCPVGRARFGRRGHRVGAA